MDCFHFCLYIIIIVPKIFVKKGKKRMEKIFVKGRCLVDEFRRERIFNGVNLVYKNDDDSTGRKPVRGYHPTWQPYEIETLARRGINVARLGLIWAAVEPQPGLYDDAYLKTIRDYADLCAQNGMYVFLDMHQDLYSDLYADGAPEWATFPDGAAYEEPLFVWAEGYFTGEAVHAAQDHFWANDPAGDGVGLIDHFAAMWKHVAAFFADCPNLIGFDILNEPFPGSSGGTVFWTLVNKMCEVLGRETGKPMQVMDLAGVLADPSQLTDLLQVAEDPAIFKEVVMSGAELIRQFDTEVYAPFFQKVASAIREATPRGILLMENCYYSNLGIPCSTPRLVYPNGKEEPQFVFTPHGYDLTVDTEAYQSASNSRVDVIFEEHKRTQERLDCPVLVGEWGAGEGKAEEIPHLAHLLDTFDRNLWSQTFWAYDTDKLNRPVIDLLSRPYPQAVTGLIRAFCYDREKRLFTLEYEQAEEYTVPTVIYLPRPFQSIETDGSYQIEKQADSAAAKLLLETGPGVHRVIIQF